MVEDQDQYFRQFARVLTAAINTEAPRGKDRPEQQRIQKQRYDRMIRAERHFRSLVRRHRFGEKTYRKFFEFLKTDRRNVLSARPFFRVRKDDFQNGGLSAAIVAGDWKKVAKFDVNYQFVRFAVGAAPWHPGSPVRAAAREVSEARNQLVLANIPLAVSTAKVFLGKIESSLLTYMDLIQTAVGGLMAGVDKCCPPYPQVFPSVLIGRIKGDLIEAYSETSLHFYPSDARKLYRANKYSKFTEDLDELALLVNQGVTKPGELVTPDELRELLAAKRPISMLKRVSPSEAEAEGAGSVAMEHEAPEMDRPDVIVERAEASSQLGAAEDALTVRDRKVLRMKMGYKGGDLG